MKGSLLGSLVAAVRVEAAHCPAAVLEQLRGLEARMQSGSRRGFQWFADSPGTR
jgi:hypothetical protein